MRSDARKRTTPEPTPLTDTAAVLAQHDPTCYFSAKDGHRECYCGHVLEQGQSFILHLAAALSAAENARAEAAVAAALAPIEALADEHERTVSPAPYTTERALIERLRAALAGGGDQ